MMHQSAPGTAPRVQGTLPPGQRVKIGHWTVSIDKFLVSGGYAHVYVVSSTEPILGATQHILKHVTVPSKHHLTLVRTEVDIMKKLKAHPYIVTFHEACASPLSNNPGAYEVFILMEYCQGGGVLDLLNARRNSRLSEYEVLHIFDHICRAVAQMHSQNPPLIHRDLKIENVLLSFDKADPSHSNVIYKLCDFGSTAPPSPPPQSVADIKHLEEEINRTTTPWYRAPEMCDISFHNPIGTPSDIWALGVLLYKLCYYTTPFEPHGTLAIQNANYTIPDFPVYSSNLKQLIQSMLRENQNSRPNIKQLHQRVCELKGISPSQEIMHLKLDQTISPPTMPSSKPALNARSSYSPINGLSAPISTTKSENGISGAVSPSNVTPMRRGRPAKAPTASTTTSATTTNAATFNNSSTNSKQPYQNATLDLLATSSTAAPPHTSTTAKSSSSSPSFAASSGFEDDFMSLRFGSNKNNQPVSSSRPASIAAPLATKPLPRSSSSQNSPSFASSKSLLQPPLSTTRANPDLSSVGSGMSQAPLSRRGGANSSGGFGDNFVPAKRNASLPPTTSTAANVPTTRVSGVDRGSQTSPHMLEQWIKSRNEGGVVVPSQPRRYDSLGNNKKVDSSDDDADDDCPEDAFRKRIPSSYSSSSNVRDGINRFSSISTSTRQQQQQQPSRIITNDVNINNNIPSTINSSADNAREQHDNQQDNSQLSVELRFPPLSPDTLESMAMHNSSQSSPNYYSQLQDKSQPQPQQQQQQQQQQFPQRSGDESLTSSDDGQNGIFELEDILRETNLDTPSEEDAEQELMENGENAGQEMLIPLSTSNTENGEKTSAVDDVRNSYTWATAEIVNDSGSNNDSNNNISKGKKRFSMIADMTSRYEQLSATATSPSWSSQRESPTTTMKRPPPPSLPKKPSSILSPNLTAATNTTATNLQTSSSPRDGPATTATTKTSSATTSPSLSSPSFVPDPQRKDKAPFKPSIAPKPALLGNKGEQPQQQETINGSHNRNSIGVGGMLRKPSISAKPANLTGKRSSSVLVETAKEKNSGNESENERPFEGVGKLRERWQATIAAAKH